MCRWLMLALLLAHAASAATIHRAHAETSPMSQWLEQEYQSMFWDSVLIYMRGIRAIELPPPPPKYDHPYVGKVTI